MRQKFELESFYGESVASWPDAELATAVDTLTDPGNAQETIYWGRNYLYSLRVEVPGRGQVEVAVKQFRNQDLRSQRRKKRGQSKAARSWHTAVALLEAGIPTPEPVLLVEARQSEGPSFFVTRRLHDFVEARYFFRALEAGREIDEFPDIAADRLIEAIGLAVRRLHDNRIWHRDLSIGNLLLQGSTEDPGGLVIYFIDLNRARVGDEPGVWQRTRDLSRLRVFEKRHQELLLQSYWGESDGLTWKRFLYRASFYGFLFKIEFKRFVRAPFRGFGQWLTPRRPYEHIPPAPLDASGRDLSVWDELSDQPHQHATRMDRLKVRLADTPLHLKELTAATTALPRIRRRYRELKAGLYKEPQPFGEMGVAVRPQPENAGALLRSLEGLGTKRVLLRLHAWQTDHRAEEELAHELDRQGYDLVLVLAQNRDLVRDPERWSAAVEELSERFGSYTNHWQIGQAINRSKWGVWNHAEYLELAARAAEILRRRPGVELLGPAVIDYEPYRTAAILNIKRPGVHFDIMASLLYVDRRGAPENRQLGFDTVDKVVQMKAIAETSYSCDGRSWITECNWPLWEGPHSPAGKDVSVDEKAQADYLARYYLLALGTGLVERIYWWQLVARGYGLSHADEHGALRLRPSFRAFATLHRQLSGSTVLGPVASQPGQYLYHYRSADGDVIVGWVGDGTSQRARLSGTVARQLDRDGVELPQPDGLDVEIDGSPRYFWLSGD